MAPGGSARASSRRLWLEFEAFVQGGLLASILQAASPLLIIGFKKAVVSVVVRVDSSSIIPDSYSFEQSCENRDRSGARSPTQPPCTLPTPARHRRDSKRRTAP